MATSRIRSGYQRRILDELLDGPATVTALAARLSLATSHTSSTLRTLRQQGLVTRDEREGVRGAPHHLSPQGLIRLQEDIGPFWSRWASGGACLRRTHPFRPDLVASTPLERRGGATAVFQWKRTGGRVVCGA